MSNLVGLVGLVLIGLAVGELTNLWWALMFAGAVLVVVAYTIQVNFERPSP